MAGCEARNGRLRRRDLFVFAQRVLFESFSWIILPVVYFASDRNRITWLRWLLDVRCKLAGVPRKKSTILRKHLQDLQKGLPIDLGRQVQLYLESADRICFGGTDQLTKTDQAAIVRVWRGLTTKAIQQGNRKNDTRAVHMSTITKNSPISSEHKLAIDLLRSRLNQVLLGKADRMELVIACLLAGGHLLLDDLPGLGKTTLAKAIACCFGAKFARIQCTPTCFQPMSLVSICSTRKHATLNFIKVLFSPISC